MSRLETIVVAFSVLVAFSGAPRKARHRRQPSRAGGNAGPEAADADPRQSRCLHSRGRAPVPRISRRNLEIIKCAEKYLQRRRNG